MKHPKVMGHELTHLDWGGESYDFIGDIHGCYQTLISLFEKLNYQYNEITKCWVHPNGNIPVFLGDLVDRGPMSFQVIALVIRMVRGDLAKYVPGNHCNKLFRHLKGNSVKLGKALKLTLEHIEIERNNNPQEVELVLNDFVDYVENCKYHLILDKGNVIAVHAAVDKDTVGIYNKKTKEKNIYGYLDKTQIDEDGRPMRIPTYDVYTGDSLVIHGHIANEEPIFKNNVLDVDTGCGLKEGKLTAYRYPEGSFVSVDVIDETTFV